VSSLRASDLPNGILRRIDGFMGNSVKLFATWEGTLCPGKKFAHEKGTYFFPAGVVMMPAK
jgi:hypothetical protein